VHHPRSRVLPIFRTFEELHEALRSVRLLMPLSTTQRYALRQQGKASLLTKLKGDCS
jgi:hypothetical protein